MLLSLSNDRTFIVPLEKFKEIEAFSSLEKENLEVFRERVYDVVREIHVTRFPYNKFLFPDFKDIVLEE